MTRAQDNPRRKKLSYAKRRKLPSQKKIGTHIRWTPDKYAAIVKGGNEYGIPGGLRKYFEGFEQGDGFDLRNVRDWTKAQKAKVRERYHRFKLITGQPKRFVRVRDEKNLRRLQQSFHDEIPSGDMKGAFVPDTEPVVSEGFKPKPMRVRVLKEGVSIERPGLYNRQFIPFDQKSLAKNAKLEVARVAEQMKDVALFYVQVGEFQSLTGMTLGIVTRQIQEWMLQYDGKKQLPSTSGNRGDSPRHHHWKHWLKGLIGFSIPKGVGIRKLIKKIAEGRRQNEELKRKRFNLESREKVAPRRIVKKRKPYKLKPFKL